MAEPQARSFNDNDNDMLPFTRWPALGNYLRSVRSFIGSPESSRAKTVLVLGNPSADLDSFVSAIIYSYFHNHRAQNSTGLRANTVFIPLLNLPKTPASDLNRLRPEFDIAVQTATAWRDPSTSHIQPKNEASDLAQVLTVNELVNSFASSQLASLFSPSTTTPLTKQPLILVDHNAPSIPGLTSEQIRSRFDVVGCIDHHVDEAYVSQNVSPRLIQIQAGSCTSLVVSHLRSEGLFPDSSTTPQGLSEVIALQQISTLSLSSILIDTNNLTSESKTTPLDHDTVTFLNSHIFIPGLNGGTFIHPPDSDAHAATVFNSRDFHDLLSSAKSHSLDNLTMQEVFDRDFKPFSEPYPSPPAQDTNHTTVEIGMSSLFQPIKWLISHAGSPSKFANAIATFGKENKLDIFLFLARSTKHGKGFGAVAFSDIGEDTVKRFEQQQKEGLGLDPYDQESDLAAAMHDQFGDQWRIWYMTQTKNTRKQIAPLIRGCVKK